MARLALSKSSLSVQNRRLKTFERYLPSLDLKRRQLIAERAKAERAIGETRELMAQLRARVENGLPMLANLEFKLDDLVHIERLRLTEENVMGVHLPMLREISIQRRDYALLAKPEWVDTLADLLAEMLELKVRLQLQQHRLALLDKAVRTVTQRVNLFDKVLIPQTRDNIKRIRIFLADGERAAVVRAKIAKGKRAKEAAA